MAGVGKFVYVSAPKKNNVFQLDRKLWSDDKKLEAVTLYVALGSPLEVSKRTGIPKATINSWQQQDWWKQQVKDYKEEDLSRLDAKMTNAIDKSMNELVDRIDNGESMYDPRTGEIRRVPAKMRDLQLAVNTLIDKRQLIRNQPTKIVKQETSAEQLKALAAEFAKFVTGAKEKDVEKLEDLHVLVEGEDVFENEDGTFEIREKEIALHDERET